MNEYATVEDLSAAFTPAVRMGFMAEFEYRRLRARGTWWLVMALDELSGPTLQLGDETLPWMLKNATGLWDKERWLTLVHGFVKDCIVPRWKQLSLKGARLGSNKRNDTVIAEDAGKRGIPVITRDQGLAKKTRDRGGVATSPEDFASAVLSVETARLRFFERYASEALRWCLRIVPGGIDWSSTQKQCDGLKWGHTLFQMIWRDHFEHGDPPIGANHAPQNK